MSISKEEFKKAADHIGVQGADRLALWAWWLKAWKCATDFDEAKERELFESAVHITHRDRGEYGEYRDEFYQCKWLGWLECAKSRATR